MGFRLVDLHQLGPRSPARLDAHSRVGQSEPLRQPPDQFLVGLAFHGRGFQVNGERAVGLLLDTRLPGVSSNLYAQEHASIVPDARRHGAPGAVAGCLRFRYTPLCKFRKLNKKSFHITVQVAWKSTGQAIQEAGNEA